MSVSSEQYDALEFARRETFVANGVSGELICLRYQNNALATYLTVANAWHYAERDYEGNQLQSDALYELQIHESLLTASQVLAVVGIRHSGIIYKIERPSPLPPTGLNRFWRFWITPQENA